MTPRNSSIISAVAALIFFCLALRCDTTSGETHYKNAVTQFDSANHGDYHETEGIEKAAKGFRKAIDKGYRIRDAFDRLAWSYHLLNKDKEVIEAVYTEALKYYSNDVEFYFRRGDIRKELKNFRDASSDFDKAVLLDTTRNNQFLKDAIYDRGAMKFLLGDSISAYRDWEQAQKIADHSLRTYPDYCRLWK